MSARLHPTHGHGHRVIVRALMWGTVIGAVACGQAAPPAAQAPAVAAPAVAAAKPKGVADGGVELGASGEAYLYSYNPVGKRDPFRSLVDEPRTTVTSDANALCSEPLCQFDLDQLSLVAVVSGDANPIAMLEDPTHTGHIVRRNSKVGKQGGKVTQVQRDCVVVTEYFQTPDGKVNPNRVNLCVKQDKTGTAVLDLLTNKSYQSP